MATSVIGRLSAILSLNASQFHSGMDKASKRMGKFRKNLNTMGRNMALPLTIAGGAMIKAASDIEKGMIGVQKTTGLADGEIQKLRNSLLEFSTQNNVTIDSLLETAKVAGQMGIQGQESISKFTQAFAKLEVASDRTVAGEAGAQAFSKFLDLSGEGIEAVESVASAMVELGNTSKTTEGQILETATQIVRNTARFNLGAANILGLATALDEAGVKTEVAGSSMQKFFEGINTAIISGKDGLQEFTDLTGRSREELRQMMETNPSQVLVEFAEGLNKANAEGRNTSEMLQAMGLGGIRAGATMNVLADRHVQLAQKLAASNEAQRQNVALQNEADAANRGTAAAMQKLINSLSTLATSRFFEQILKGFTGIIEILTKFANFLGNTVMPVAIQVTSDLITAFMDMKESVVGFVTDMVDGIKDVLGRPFEAIKEKVMGWTETVTGAFKSMADKVSLFSYVPDMVDVIADEFSRLPDIMVNPTETYTGSVTDSFRTMRDSISTLLSDIINGTKSFGDSLKSILGGIADNIIGKGIDRVSDAITSGIAAKVSGSGSFTGAASKSLFGGVSKLFGGAATTTGAGGSAALGGISGASVTGGAQGAGLGGGSAAGAGSIPWGAAGLAIPFVAGQLIKELKIGGFGDTPEYVKVLKDIERSGFSGMGPLGGRVGQGERGTFSVGPNAGFAGEFARSQGVGTATGGGTIDESLAERGVVGFKGLDLDGTIRLLEQAEAKFESLKSSARTTLQLGQKESVKVGKALQDGLIDQTELADLGFIGLGERIENTKSGVIQMGDVSIEQFDKIINAVNNGTFRLEALRGETRLNQREMQFLGQTGLTAAGQVQSGFNAAAGSIKSFGQQSVAALREIEGAARSAGGAVAGIGSAGGEGPAGAAAREQGLTQQLRNDAQRNNQKGR